MKLYATIGDFRAFKSFIVSKFNGVDVEFRLCKDPESRVFQKRLGGRSLPLLETSRGDILGSCATATYVASRAVGDNQPPNFCGDFSPFDKASVDGWLEWCATTLEPRVARCVDPICFPDRFRKEDRMCMKEAQRVAQESREFRDALRVLEQALDGKRPFLVGDFVTIADVAVVAALYYPFALFMGSKLSNAHPNVSRYFLACMATDPFKTTLGDPLVFEGRKSASKPALDSEATVGRANGRDKRDHVRGSAAACHGGGNLATADRVGTSASRMNCRLAEVSVRYAIECARNCEHARATSADEMFLMSDATIDEKLDLPDLTKNAGMSQLDAHLCRRNFLFEGVVTKQDVTLRSAVLDALRHCLRAAEEIEALLELSAEEWQARPQHVAATLARCLECDLDDINSKITSKAWATLRKDASKEAARLRKLNRGRGQHIGKQHARRPMYPNVSRWFEHVGRLMAFEATRGQGRGDAFKQPSNPLLRWKQQRQARVLRIVKACEHPLYVDWFELLGRRIPLHGVQARMDKRLDKDVLRTPERMLPVYEGQTEPILDHLKARPLKTLTRAEARNVFLNVSKSGNKELQMTSMDLGIIARGIASGNDPGVGGGGKLLDTIDEDGLLELDGCADAEAEAKEALRIIQTLKRTCVSFALLKNVPTVKHERPAEPLTDSVWCGLRSGIVANAIAKTSAPVLGVSFLPKRSHVDVRMLAFEQSETWPSISRILDLVDPSDASSTVVAFDFDLTLKGLVDPVTNIPRVRGGQRTLEVLRKLRDMNVNMVVVTAQQPSRGAWDIVKSRARSLGLDAFIGKGRRLVGNMRDQARRFYDSVKSEKKSRGNFPTSDEILDEFEIQYACSFPEGDGRVRLKAALKSTGSKKTVNWRQFRTALETISPVLQMKPPAYDSKVDPKVDLKYGEKAPLYLYSPLKSETGQKTWPCWPCTSPTGKRFVAGEGFIMSEYDKAESLHAYLNAYKFRPKHIIFVDDFVGNVHNVAWYFNCEFQSKEVDWPEGDPMESIALSKPTIEPLSPTLKRVTSIWWNPVGERERHDRAVSAITEDPSKRVEGFEQRVRSTLASFEEATKLGQHEVASHIQASAIHPLLESVVSSTKDADGDNKLKYRALSDALVTFCSPSAKKKFQRLLLLSSKSTKQKCDDNDVDEDDVTKTTAELVARFEKRVESCVGRYDFANASKIEKELLRPIRLAIDASCTFFEGVENDSLTDQKRKLIMTQAFVVLQMLVREANENISTAKEDKDYAHASELQRTVLTVCEQVLARFNDRASSSGADASKESNNCTEKNAVGGVNGAKAKIKASTKETGAEKKNESFKTVNEKSTSKEYVSLVDVIKAGVFEDTKFYPFVREDSEKGKDGAS